jgi:hypothetical protein
MKSCRYPPLTATSILTVGIGIISLYLFPADPSKTRIFTEEERELAMARIFHDQPAIREHKEQMSWSLIKRGIVNVNVLVGAWIYICDQITVQGLSIFTATILRLNFPDHTTVQIQLLSAAPPLVGMVVGLGVAYVTMRTRQHGFAIAVCAALNVVGYSIWLASSNVEARFAAIFLNTAGGYSFGVLVLGWTLANAAPDTVRNVANGAVSGLANIGECSEYCRTECQTDENEQDPSRQHGATSTPTRRTATASATLSTRPPRRRSLSPPLVLSSTKGERTRSVLRAVGTTVCKSRRTRWLPWDTFTRSSGTFIRRQISRLGCLRLCRQISSEST